MSKKKLILPGVLAFLLALSCESGPREFLVADMDPLPAGSAELGLNQNPFGSAIRPTLIPVTYDPRTDTAILQFTYQTVTYKQFWTKADRDALRTAVTLYKSDYENRNLPPRNAARTRRTYGFQKRFRTEWGALSLMINSRAYPRLEFGYMFNRDSPYFTVTQRSAPNVRDNSSGNGEGGRSLHIILYMTRDMADELASLFEQDYLVSLTAGGPDVRRSGRLVPDAY